MIQRMVFMKINSTADINEIVQATKASLPVIPGVKSVQTGQIHQSAEFDLGLLITFDNSRDVKNFGDHPQHRQYVDDFLKSRITKIKAYNIEII